MCVHQMLLIAKTFYENIIESIYIKVIIPYMCKFILVTVFIGKWSNWANFFDDLIIKDNEHKY